MASVRRRAGLRPLAWVAAGLLLTAAAAPTRAAEPMVVPLNQAVLFHLPPRTATIVLGEPLIASVSIQPGGVVVIGGKTYGSTNLVIMDREGAILMEKTIVVKGSSDPTVVVYRGATRQTYSCTSQCEPTVTLGDSGTDLFDGNGAPKGYFADVLGQSRLLSAEEFRAADPNAH